MSALYDSAKQMMFTTGLNWETKSHYLALISDVYMFDDKHSTLADVIGLVNYTKDVTTPKVSGPSIKSDWELKVMDSQSKEPITSVLLVQKADPTTTSPDAADKLIIFYDDWELLPFEHDLAFSGNGGVLYISPEASGGDAWLTL